MLSIPHLIIVFIVALVVFGPEKLPELARNVGKIMGEFKRATGDLRSTFEGHMRDLEREAGQRRTASTVPDASGAAPGAVAEYEAHPPVVAPGTVPTVPSHLLGIGTSAEGLAEVGDTSAVGDTSEIQASAGHEQSLVLDPEHHPETLTDAGTPPA